ncbi:MAG TPA: MBL fold metallo-hydrolase [Solirubrobacteraceae bacterium]|nr:MBL fold metallo-hydrolase [Solirubrobacteraceae bacterium]
MERISRFGLVNAYLVPEDDGLTLVDTLIPRSARPVLAAAERIGAPIRRIALTHAHGDHVGSLDDLVAALPGVEVLISARDARLLARDMALDPGEPDTKLRGSYPGTKTRPTRELQPADRVGSLEVIATPGHTPGHVAFLDPRDRTLYCGDVFSTLGGVATSARVNPRFPLTGMATWHGPTVLGSARALRALDAARLAPGHGKVVEAPAAAMDAAIAKGAA